MRSILPDRRHVNGQTFTAKHSGIPNVSPLKKGGGEHSPRSQVEDAPRTRPKRAERPTLSGDWHRFWRQFSCPWPLRWGTKFMTPDY